MTGHFVFMHPFFTMFGRVISGYALMGMIGFLLSIVYLLIRAWKKHFSLDDAIYIFAFAAIGAMIGAKILYLLLSLPDLVHALTMEGSDWMTVAYQYISGGMVFYGGLFGGIAGAFLSARYFRVDIRKQYGGFVPVIPLFGGFGRLGCLMMGCCYGQETTAPIHVVFHHSPFAPNFTSLVPTQAYEAAFDFILFALLVYLSTKVSLEGHLLSVYLTCYAAFRFVIEFFRGDDIRGVFLLSTSQWISLLILLVVLALQLRKIASKEKVVYKWGK